MLSVQSGNQLKNQFSGAPIEVAGRLICQQDLRLGDQRPGKRQPLLFATGKLS